MSLEARILALQLKGGGRIKEKEKEVKISYIHV